jgi:hypothetical protein
LTKKRNLQIFQFWSCQKRILMYIVDVVVTQISENMTDINM